MKKIITLASIVTGLPFASQAQEHLREPWREVDIERLVTNSFVIITFFLIAGFVLTIIRILQDHRLKAKMIEKGVSDKIVEQFLQPTRRDNKSAAIKWALIMFCVGAGLIVIYNSLPLGIHSLAIMAFSISASFLGYFWYIHLTEKSAPRRDGEQERE
ncbi:MAG TPA: DUF6249 domain-containing protein [Puia sp.]|nr:DUF6249 domain-containing protein [Puia sp.]